MLLGVHHVAIATADLDRLRGFYCTQLGMEQISESEWADFPLFDAIVGLPGSAAKVCMLRAGNLALEIFQYAQPKSEPGETNRPVNKPGITHFGFAVDDVDAEYARLCAAGVRFHGAPSDKAISPDEMPLRAVYGRDPDGNVFELMEFVGETPLDYAPGAAEWRGAKAG
jgi:catechol 2,3-dioxygenase-like lactoylglutathione lyase family enzyme